MSKDRRVKNRQNILDEPPFMGDLDAELRPRPTRRRLPKAALILATGIVAVAGFIGGVQAHKAQDDTASAQPPGGQMPGQMPGRMPSGGGQGRMPGMGNGGLTSGTIGKAKDGSLKVTTPDGRTVKLKPGDTILLRQQGETPDKTEEPRQ